MAKSEFKWRHFTPELILWFDLNELKSFGFQHLIVPFVYCLDYNELRDYLDFE